jgi:tetratricopeptide (TPR) repeat protein
MPDGSGPRDTLTPGAKVAHFRIVRELGKGGYGVVHLAEDLEIPGRLVALKSVRPGPVMPDAEVLRHEAAALAALQHPHILVVHEIGEGPSGIFLAAEYMPGGSVSDRVFRDPPLTEAEVLTLARSAADALAAAHQAGLVHRDFKPGNLLLAADGLAKVADFGIAMRQSETAPAPPPVTLPTSSSVDATVTATVADGRVVVGTPAYMPPEIFTGTPWTTQGDQFSFGIVLHEMLAAAHPFDLSLGIVATRQPPALSAALPADLKRIAARCLAREPGDRYPDMRAVVAALDEAIRRRSPERKLTWRVAIAGIAVVAVLLASWAGWRAVKERQARALNEEGLAALKRGDRDAARAALVTAHSAAPWYLPACTNLGQLAAIEESPTWAETILRDCVATFPEAPTIRYNLGAVLVKSGNLQPAIAELTRALELAIAGEPEMRPLAANELARAYIASRRPREAITVIENERPNATTLEGALELRTLGLAYIDAGDAGKAIDALTSALSGRLPASERPETLVALGRTAEAAGAPNDAVLHYSQALVEGATGDTADAARKGLARLQSSLR